MKEIGPRGGARDARPLSVRQCFGNSLLDLSLSFMLLVSVNYNISKSNPDLCLFSETMKNILSETEAVTFVCDKLFAFEDGIAMRHSMKEDSLNVLNKLIRTFHFKVPFQNIGLLAKSFGTQDIPTSEEIKSDGLTGVGGLCYTNNVFFCNLLQAIGYRTQLVSGTCNPKHPNNHIATLVNDVAELGDKYLVDVGCGYPTLQAVPLGFENESPVYKNIFLQYKFVKLGSGHYERQHLLNLGKERLISLQSSCYSEKWERYYDFEDVPRDLSYFKPAMTEVYKDRFLRKFRALNFSDSSMAAVKEHGWKCVDLQFKVEEEPEEIIMEEEDTIVRAASKKLPQYDSDFIERALTHWKRFLSK